MPSVGQMIQFKAGLHANFAAITSKDVNTIYFCTDTQQIFVGDTEYSRPVLSGTGAPSDGAAKHNPPRTLYFDTTNKNLYVTLDDGKWVKITDSSIASNLTTLQNTVNNISTRLTTAEGEIDDLQALPATGITQDNITSWNNKVGSVALSSGTNNGTVKLTVDGVATDNIAVKGLGSAAYTDSSAYATSAQGTKADNAMPKSGGTFTGAITLNADPTTDLQAATKQYVDSKTAALTGAMHFVGVSTTDPTGSSGATVSGHTTWAAGDVVLYGTKEYVLKAATNAAANWIELGDEGSHALKTTTITAGGGLTGGGDLSANRTISHAAKSSSLSNVDKSANTFVSGVAFDDYGHATSVETSTISGSDGITVDSGAIKHTNSVTAQSTESLLKVKYDAQGHITGSSAVAASDIPGLSGKQDALTTEQLSAVNSGITSSKVSSYDTHVGNADIHVTADQKAAWTAKQDALTAGSGISLSGGTIDTTAKTYIVKYSQGDWTPTDKPELAAQLTAIYNAAVAGDTFNVVMAVGTADMYPCNVSYIKRTQTITIVAHKQSGADIDLNGHLTYQITRSASTSPNITCTSSNYYAEMDTLGDSSDNRWLDAPTSASVGRYVENKLSTKQDTLVFNTAYNASTNKVATMADIQNASLVWGSF